VVTGRRISPPLFESMGILGRESSLTRLRSLRRFALTAMTSVNIVLMQDMH